MSRYLAHVVARTGGAPPAAGLRGLPLRWLDGGDLGIWATEWSAEPTLTREDAFAHHDLVGVLCEGAPCLPVRFGTWLADERAAERSIEAAHERFAAALDRVGDRQEVAVTLLWPDARALEGGSARAGEAGPGRTMTPGTAYLERRRAAHAAADERRHEAEALAERLGSQLAADQADVRHETCPSDEVALSMSLLAQRGEAAALKARATALVAELTGVRGVVSGPWPPYSFSEELGATGGS